jgi:hypothetical protein
MGVRVTKIVAEIVRQKNSAIKRAALVAAGYPATRGESYYAIVNGTHGVDWSTMKEAIADAKAMIKKRHKGKEVTWKMPF